MTAWKTYLAISIGIESARKRISTYFVKCHDLIQNLKKARNENRLESRLKFYSSKKLLIIDEIGYLPISVNDAKLFFQLIDRRYKKKSTLLTTNMPFKDWGEIFLDPKIANAILDRVLHHAKDVLQTPVDEKGTKAGKKLHLKVGIDIKHFFESPDFLLCGTIQLVITLS